MSDLSLSRRLVGALAGAGLLVGLLPTVASAATPEKRDITEFACPTAEVPDPEFSDDDETTAEHRASIWCVVWYEIASGRTATTYAPSQAVNRGQMATFIANLLLEAGVALPDPPPDAFSDDNGTQHEKAINQLAAVGVVEGDEQGRYNAHLPVKRAQMASFLNRAYEEVTGAPLTSSEDYFTDDEGAFHEDNINAVAGAGIAAGKTATTYAPAESVKRDQMATFIARLVDLLVEEGDITKPVSKPADVKLTSSSVQQGGKVTGSIDTQEGVEVTGARVSGCGVDQALTLEGDAHAFSFNIPVQQPTGKCTLTFTIEREEGDDLTDQEELTVTQATGQTAGPDLIKAERTSTSADGSTVTIRYTFDEALRQVSIDRTRFRIYDASANRTVASSVSHAGSGAVDAVFPASDFSDATTATVTASAVEDAQSVTNPEGARPLPQTASTVEGTNAPDLEQVTQITGTNDWLFLFDEPIVAHPGAASNYHLVLDDGNVLDGQELTDETDDEQVQVRFFPIEDIRFVVRGYVDTDTVAGEEQDTTPITGEGVENGNPTHAEDVKGGGGDTPYLTNVAIDATNNRVTYTFNRAVTVISKGMLDDDVFIAYDLDGDEVGTNSATRSGPTTIVATFSGSPDPITASTVGASVRPDAVRSETEARPNEVDEKLVAQKTTLSGAQGGETSAPDLRSVTRSIEGNDSVVTYTFDQATSLGSTTSPTSGDFAVYQANGSRTELDDCAADGNTVECRAVSTTATGQLIDSAVLGGVEYDAVRSTATSPRSNYEASAPVT